MSEYRRNRSRVEKALLRGVPHERRADALAEVEKTLAWQMAALSDALFTALGLPWLRFVKAKWLRFVKAKRR